MKILREKIFGAVKRANKAKKRAQEIEDSFNTYGKEAFNHGMVRSNGRPIIPEEEAISMTRYNRQRYPDNNPFDKSKASIEKHKEKADKLRSDNKLKIAARDAKRSAKKWIKENPGKSAAIGAGVAAIGAGLGYAAYKHHKTKKKEDGGSKN